MSNEREASSLLIILHSSIILIKNFNYFLNNDFLQSSFHYKPYLSTGLATELFLFQSSSIINHHNQHNRQYCFLNGNRNVVDVVPRPKHLNIRIKCFFCSVYDYYQLSISNISMIEGDNSTYHCE